MTADPSLAEQPVDQIVIGAGIAGASVAAELAETGRVVLLEAEAQAGYHTTGRSAAQFSKTYGPPVIRALTRASEAFFRTCHTDQGGDPLLKPRGVLFVARADQSDAFDQLAGDLGDAVERLSRQDCLDLSPLLRPDYVAQGLLEADAADIDVDALHQHYLRRFRALGGELKTRAPVTALQRQDGLWQVSTAVGRFSAPVVVNAAGAWADEVAALAQVSAAGLVPKRRTALLVDAPDHQGVDALPMVVDVEETFYLKPDAGKLLLSPADATDSPPCDAQPDEMDVAICVDRIETAFDLQIRRIAHKWAGLRNFVPGGTPCACFDPDAPGFFWLAGQGGYGIQSAPALARFAAALITDAPVPDDILAQGVRPEDLLVRQAGGTA